MKINFSTFNGLAGDQHLLLIAGKTHDKTCISGYSIVHSRYGWIRAELVGINADIEKLKNGK